MINIIFLLLIFFIIAGSIEVVDTLDVLPPKANAADNKPQVNAIIYLSKDGRIALNSDIVAEKDLPTVIKTLFIDNPKQQVSIKSDAGVPAKTLLMVMKLIEQSGGSEVSLITQANNK
jgi:biopolymer transport protein ExbD